MGSFCSGRGLGGGLWCTMDEGNLPVGHIQRVKVAPRNEISEERLSLTTGRPVANDDPGAAEVETHGSTLQLDVK